MEERCGTMAGSSPFCVSVDHLAGAEKFEFWRDFSRNSIAGLGIEALEPHSFAVGARGRLLPGMGLMHLRSSASVVTRDPDAGLDSSADHIVINLVRSGSLLAEQDGRVAHVRAGGAVMCVADRPYSLQFDTDLEVMVMKIERNMLSRPSSLESLTAVDLASVSQTGRLLMSYAAGLAAFNGADDCAMAARLSRGAVDFLEAVLGSVPGGDKRSLTRHREATILRIKRFVRGELTNPELDTGLIARRVGLSARYVNKLFEAEGITPWRFITMQRLSGAANDLADGRLTSLPIAEIARRNGYGDPNHFSSSFRKAFGQSPRAYRNHCLSRRDAS